MTQQAALKYLNKEYEQKAKQLRERILQLEYKRRELQNNFNVDAMLTMVGVNNELMIVRNELAMVNVFNLRLSQIVKLP